MIYTHVLNKGGLGVRSPADLLKTEGLRGASKRRFSHPHARREVMLQNSAVFSRVRNSASLLTDCQTIA